MELRGYGKVFSIDNKEGAAIAAELRASGSYYVQEKVDGSQIRFCVTLGAGGEPALKVASRNNVIDINFPPKLFRSAVLGLIERVPTFYESDFTNVVFYGECLETTRHNKSMYGRVPTGNIALFDAYQEVSSLELDGVVRTTKRWLSIEELRFAAKILNIDVVPSWYCNEWAGIVDCMEKQSFLGGSQVEGVVLKPLNSSVSIEGRGAVKMVNKSLVDRKSSGTNKPKNATADPINSSMVTRLVEFIESYASEESDFLEAVKALREQGHPMNSLKETGALLKYIYEDMKEEDAATIKEKVFEIVFPAFVQMAQRGAKTWYMEALRS